MKARGGRGTPMSKHVCQSSGYFSYWWISFFSPCPIHCFFQVVVLSMGMIYGLIHFCWIAHPPVIAKYLPTWGNSEKIFQFSSFEFLSLGQGDLGSSNLLPNNYPLIMSLTISSLIMSLTVLFNINPLTMFRLTTSRLDWIAWRRGG